MKNLYIENDLEEPTVPQTKEFKEANYKALQELIKKYCGNDSAPF